MNNVRSHRLPIDHERGFALVVTLSLMILLIVIAIGMLTLSSISVRSSNSASAMTEARGNARMAMMLALGELQKHAGQDQRVTATADIAGAAGGAFLEVGENPANENSVNAVPKGLSSLQDGTRYWTGVWKNSNTTNPETEIFTKTPSPMLVTWLVSGSDGATPATPKSSFVALDSGGNVSNPKTAVVLVGANTVGQASSTNLPHYVSVPLVSITSSANSTVKGRYGWWIGDEGVKARINEPSDANSTLSYANLCSRRRGWENAGITDYPARDSDSILGNVVTLSQAELLAPSLRDKKTGPLGIIFHAATCDSKGVLSNTIAGGLRLDLSAYLDSLPVGLLPGITYPPWAANKIIPPTVAPNIKGPTWAQLKNFKELHSTLITNGGTLLCKPIPANSVSESAIAPIIADFRVLQGFKMELIGSPATATSYKLHTCGKIAIVLANPYPYPLKWTNGLDVEMIHKVPANSTAGYRPSCLFRSGDQPVDRAYFSNNGTEPAVFRNTLFRIPAGEIPAGEARAYTVSQATARANNSIAQAVVPMDLLDSSSTQATNFEKCMQQTYDAPIQTNPPSNPNPFITGTRLDIREDMSTSPFNVELRPAGSDQILRCLEGLDLDTGMNFTVAGRDVSLDRAKTITKPIPLMYFGFQISQPGGKYEDILPAAPANQLGLRGSTLRTFADFNLQATRCRRTIASYNPPPYFMVCTDSGGDLPQTVPGGDTGARFAKGLGSSPVKWGRSSLDTEKVILFSPPQALVSLAQFQHADLTADDLAVSVAHQPGNAFGNSYAPLFLKRQSVVELRNDSTLRETPWPQLLGNVDPRNYYDICHLLNSALWDSYYFSTIPRSGATEPLNKTIEKLSGSDQSPELQDGLQAAGRLLINGSFNINCTEKDAWKALLAGTKHVTHPAGGATSEAALYARSIEQTAAGTVPPSGTTGDSYAGFRRLTDAQIDTIAQEIVKQVRLRGPFLSLSHFVNRALVNIGTTSLADSTMMGRSGTLQSALDSGGANIKPDGSAIFSSANFDVNIDRLNLQMAQGRPREDLVGNPNSRPTIATLFANEGNSKDWAAASQNFHPGAIASIVADRNMLSDPNLKNEQGYRSTGIPGWLTQADVLQVIGPSISARSDTFRIRTYGEALDGTGKTIARAWCEAIVQRTPNYVDPADSASERGTDLNLTNNTFGRAFTIVSFRWLSSDEI